MNKVDSVNELFKKEGFCVDFFENIDDVSKIKEIFVNENIELTDEEVDEIIRLAQNIAERDSDELDEKDLGDVAGGFVGWVIAGVASGIFFGYQMYKTRKTLNTTNGTCSR